MDKLHKIKVEFTKLFEKLKDKTSEKLADISPKWQERAKYFGKMVIDRKEIIVIGLLSIILMSLILTVLVPNIKDTIISDETKSLVGNEFKENDYVELIPYNKIEKAIVKSESITIAIIDQHDKNYPVFQKVLKDIKNGAKLDMPVYLYPLVNDKDNVKKYFKLNKGLTLIHFENKKETGRVSLIDEQEIEENMFDYLKSLNEGKKAMTASELEKSKVKADKEAKGEDTKKKNSDIIDELKDIII